MNSPTVMIGLNLALLAFLLIVAKRILLPSSSVTGVEDLVAVADGVAVIPGTGLRVPVAPSEDTDRALFIGDWARILGFGDEAQASAALTAALAQRRPGRAIEVVVLHAPSLTPVDIARLPGFAPALQPGLVVFSPAARAPYPAANQAAATTSTRPPPRLFKHSDFPAEDRVPDEILTNPTRPRLFLAEAAGTAAPTDPAERESLIREVEWALRFVIRNDLGKLSAAGCAVAIVGWAPPAFADESSVRVEPEALRVIAAEVRAAYVDGAFLAQERPDRLDRLADWLAANW